jgi:hypothetical protein
MAGIAKNDRVLDYRVQGVWGILLKGTIIPMMLYLVGSIRQTTQIRE